MRLTDEGISLSGVTDAGTKFDFHRVRQIAVQIDQPQDLQLAPRVLLEISTEAPS